MQWPKRPQKETEPSTSLPSQPCLTLVSLDLQGMSVVPVVMGIAHLHGVLQVPPFSPDAGVATAMMVGPSSLGFGGAEPPSKKARLWSFLSVSSQYAHGVVHWFIPLSLLLFLF
jgi:hypothetical protein